MDHITTLRIDATPWAEARHSTIRLMGRVLHSFALSHLTLSTVMVLGRGDVVTTGRHRPMYEFISCSNSLTKGVLPTKESFVADIFYVIQMIHLFDLHIQLIMTNKKFEEWYLAFILHIYLRISNRNSQDKVDGIRVHGSLAKHRTTSYVQIRQSK